MTGGGSGGHIIPILAVAKELKKQNKSATIVYIGLKGDVLADVAKDKSTFDQIYFVSAGKFRRYHGHGYKQIFDLKTQYLNIRDFFKVILGFSQSLRLLKKVKPDIIFSRGGFVVVPVCLAAKFKKIPYVTHDSDAIPSLANRIVAPWAAMHFVALPKETYQYNQENTVTTGIPVSDDFTHVTKELKSVYRKKISIPDEAKMLFITGGGLGASELNDALVQVVPHLTEEFKDLHVVHLTGIKKYEKVKEGYREYGSSRVQIIDFTTELYLYSGAADIVVARAGANSLAELAVQGKATVLVPASFLVAGHQIENAKILEAAGAVKVISDHEVSEDPNRLAKMISDLFKNPKEIKSLETEINKFAVPNTAGDIASRLLKIVENGV